MELGIDIEQGRAELRQQIKFFLDRKGLKQYQLARQLGWNEARFSQLMNSDSFGVEHLDKIAVAFDLPEGALYKYMLTELFSAGGYFRTASANQFIKRCLEIDKRQYILPVLYRMLDRRYAREALFTLAETCFSAGYREEILAFYEIQISDDLNRFSERVAVSYFRRFLILRDRGIEHGLTALHQMLMYVSYLPHEINLEAHLRIITFHYARNDWKNVLEYACSLEQIAKEGEFYAKALLYQSFAARETGQMKKALHLTDRYALINDYFANLATGNRLIIRIKMGDLTAIPLLIEYSTLDDSVHQDVPTILEAYLSVGDLKQASIFLQEYQHEVVRLIHDQSPLYRKYRLKFHYFHAKYLIATGNIRDSLTEMIEGLKLADILQDDASIRNCLSLFVANVDYATPEQRKAIEELLKRGEKYEKMVCRSFSGSEPVSI